MLSNKIWLKITTRNCQIWLLIVLFQFFLRTVIKKNRNANIMMKNNLLKKLFFMDQQDSFTFIYKTANSCAVCLIFFIIIIFSFIHFLSDIFVLGRKNLWSNFLLTRQHFTVFRKWCPKCPLHFNKWISYL